MVEKVLNPSQGGILKKTGSPDSGLHSLLKGVLCSVERKLTLGEKGRLKNRLMDIDVR